MSTLHDDVISKYKNRVFVETGSWRGEAITRALKHGFEKVISIELAENWYMHCKRLFWDNEKVMLYHGDSARILYDVIKDIDEPITFWIDAHKSDSNTAQSELGAPIPYELRHIAKHHIKTHTILIDDRRCWHKKGGFPFGGDEINQWLKDINSDYKITYEDGAFPEDIIVAQI